MLSAVFLFELFSFPIRFPALPASEISVLLETFSFNGPPRPTPSPAVSSSAPVRPSLVSSILPYGLLALLSLLLMDVRRLSPHSTTYSDLRPPDIAVSISNLFPAVYGTLYGFDPSKQGLLYLPI